MVRGLILSERPHHICAGLVRNKLKSELFIPLYKRQVSCKVGDTLSSLQYNERKKKGKQHNGKVFKILFLFINRLDIVCIVQRRRTTISTFPLQGNKFQFFRQCGF